MTRSCKNYAKMHNAAVYNNILLLLISGVKVEKEQFEQCIGTYVFALASQKRSPERQTFLS